MNPPIAAIFALTLTITTCSARHIVDLTHVLDDNAPQYPLIWPNFTYFKIETMSRESPDVAGMWITIGRVEFYEHIGTHMDAPLHFGSHRQTMSEIPPDRLIGPGVVIDIKEKSKADPNYAVSKQDLEEYENRYGRIPPGAIVFMNSGWSKFYGDHETYLGSKDLRNVTSFNFPGFGLDACEFLLADRQVSVVGVDTMSLDPGQSPDTYGRPYPCHHHLQPENVPLLENVANLDAIPPTGTTIVLGGLKTKTGTGGPIRILAIHDDDAYKAVDSSVSVVSPLYFLVYGLSCFAISA